MSDVVELFLRAAPLCVLARTALEHLFDAERLDDLFHRAAQRQYQRELLFSCQTHLLLRVVLGIKPTVHAAYKDASDIAVSFQALYAKLARTDDAISEQLVADSAAQVRPAIEQLDALRAEPVPGFRARVIDGNLLGGTERRVQPLRDQWARGLPGRVLVVYEPARDLVTHAFLTRDAHACERTRMDDALGLVRTGDLWLADSHFCTHHILRTIHATPAHFLIRQHTNMTGRLVGERREVGRVSTGVAYEQALEMLGPNEGWTLRRLTLVLDQPTADGLTELHVLTNVPDTEADATVLLEAYRQRWTIERRFYDVSQMLDAEPKTLAYPAAALFAFCLGLAVSNAVALMRAALRSVHTAEVADEMSNYHMAREIRETYRGMLVVWPAGSGPLVTPAGGVAERLRAIAARVRPGRYQKAKRGPKKPPPPKPPYRNGATLSTQRLLDQRSSPPTTP